MSTIGGHACAALEIGRQHPELVLAALSENLSGLAAQLPDPALAGPLGFFGRLAGWAARQAVIESRAAHGADSMRELRRRANEVGADGKSLGDLAEALATVAATGNAEAGEILAGVLDELRAAEDAPVLAVAQAAGGVGVPDVVAMSGYLADRFRDDSHATAVTVIPGGYSKTTLLVDAVIGGEPQQIVLRQVPAGQDATALRPEFDVLTAVWSPEMLVPEPLWLEEADTVVGGPFFVSRRAAGTPLGTVSGAGGAQVPADVITDLARFLARLHALDATQVDSAPVLPMRHPDEVRAAIDDLVARSRASVGEPAVGLRAALGWLRAHVPTTPAVSVIHGDPGFQNTLAENGRMTAALDWERAHLGDAAEDLAYVMPSVSEVYDWKAFLEAYEAAGGRVPDEANLRFYVVWQDVWRYVECARLGESFYTSGTFSSAIAGFVLGPDFLDSALTHAFADLKGPTT